MSDNFNIRFSIPAECLKETIKVRLEMRDISELVQSWSLPPEAATTITEELIKLKAGEATNIAYPLLNLLEVRGVIGYSDLVDISYHFIALDEAVRNIVEENREISNASKNG